MSQVLLLSVRFDDAADGEPSPGLVTVHHPSGRRFLLAEITDDELDTDAEESIW